MHPVRFPLTSALASLTLVALTASSVTLGADPPASRPEGRQGNESSEGHDGHESHPGYGSSSRSRSSAPLVERVQKATRRYRNINVALAEGWMPGTPCVSGPSSGAMGVHFVLPSRIDGKVNPDEPEALIYEPLPGGNYRLVGVEYLVIAQAWADDHPGDSVTPAIDGHLTHYVGAPNRYGLPAFYELHVWAWADNPNGNFADWNSEVTCDKQAAD